LDLKSNDIVMQLKLFVRESTLAFWLENIAMENAIPKHNVLAAVLVLKM